MNTPKEELMKCLSNQVLQCVDGVNLSVSNFIPDATKQLALIRDAEIREDDVISFGFTRSGNHWAFEMITMILHQSTEFAKLSFLHNLLDTMGDALPKALANMQSPRILTCHHRAQSLPSQAVEKKVKIIYLLRNPKDVLVSFYLFLSGMRDDSIAFKGTWDQFFQLQMLGEFPLGSWFDHVLATERFMKEHPECPLHVFLYEDAKKDPVGKIKELCSFLGKPDALAEEIASTTTFQNMKQYNMAGARKELIDKIMKSSDVMYRKGIIGDWKSWFTVAQNEYFDCQFEKKMAGSQLGNLVRPYIGRPEITS